MAADQAPAAVQRADDTAFDDDELAAVHHNEGRQEPGGIELADIGARENGSDQQERQLTSENPAPASAPSPLSPITPASATPARARSAGDATALTNTDIYYTIKSLDDHFLATLVRSIDNRGALAQVISRQEGFSVHRSDDAEPEVRHSGQVQRKGVNTEVRSPAGIRGGLLSWNRLRQWVASGLDQRSQQLLLDADRMVLRYALARKGFRALGETSLHAAAEREIHTVLLSARDAILDRALYARQAGIPLAALVRRARNDPEPTATLFDPGPENGPNESHPALTAIHYLQQLDSVLPPQVDENVPLSQLVIGDFLEHPGYPGDTFRLTALPQDRGDYFDLPGELLRQAGVVPFRLHKHLSPDPPVRRILLPTSLALFVPSPQIAADPEPASPALEPAVTSVGDAVASAALHPTPGLFDPATHERITQAAVELQQALRAAPRSTLSGSGRVPGGRHGHRLRARR
ncbi:hypothetical protein ACFQX6_67010 [Streptosporangium lutulentum]